MKNNTLISRLINKAMKIVDTEEIEWKYIYHKLDSKIDFINLPAKNYFTKGYSTTMIKCCYRFNYYSRRN